MQIIKVIPFSKTLRRDYLTYFSKEKIAVGSIVSINLRKKTVPGLVIGSSPGERQKSEIKASDFALRKVKKVYKQSIFSKSFVMAAKATSEYYATSTGAVLNSLTPANITDSIAKLPEIKTRSFHERASTGEKFVVQESDTERYSHYKGLIREEFAKKRSVLFVCPTIEDCLHASSLLYKGIEDSTFVLHSKLTKKQTIDEWRDAITHDKPVLLIVTGTFMGIPRHDIGSIIIERESSSAYRRQDRPYIDLRYCAERYAEELKARLILGDLLLRSDTILRYNNHELYDRSPLQFRSLSTAKQEVVDMGKVKNDGKTFEVLSDNLKELVKATKQEDKNLFIFTVRKGLSPSVVCIDCNQIVTCPNCSKGLVLYGKDATKEGNVLRCHSCGYKSSAGVLCKKCNSWRLNTLGIGTELVEKEVAKLVPKENILVLDSQTAKTPKQARDIMERFYKQPGTILIGTEMATLYLHDEIEHSAIASLDSLFSVPEFFIREKIMYTLLKIRSKTTQQFIIQTRRMKESVFEYIQIGNFAEFYREELRERKDMDFPPYTLIVKISAMGREDTVKKEMEELVEYFKPYELHVYKAFIERVKQKTVINGILKLKRKEWVEPELLRKLQTLPPQFKVVVDTESLL